MSNRSDESIVWVSDDTLRSWLAVRYGDDEAARAMTLPRDLLNHMYGSILKYGPAAEEIPRIIQAARNADVLDVLPSLRRVSEMWFDASCLRLYGVNTNFQGWLISRGHSPITRLVANASSEFTVAADGWRMLFWLMNGQYIFPTGMVDPDSEYVKEANKILTWLNLPLLGGSLVAVGESRDEQ